MSEDAEARAEPGAPVSAAAAPADSLGLKRLGPEAAWALGLKFGGLKFGGLKFGGLKFGGLKFGGLKFGGL